MIDWVEVIVPVGASDVDDVAALVAMEVPAASAGTEQRGDEVVFWVARDDAAAALAQTRDAMARWQAGGAAIDPAKARIADAMPEAEWRDAWKKYFKVSRLTRQVVVVPSWESYAPAADDVCIALDPGMAFGTGTHASTQLVLEMMQTLRDAVGSGGVKRVLDMGCGSGILAIAAVKLWPDAVCVAIDNDPIAVTATDENAAANGVAAKVRAGLPDALVGLGGGEPFDLVLANIQAHVLRALQAQLIAATAPGGTLMLSGLLLPQVDPLAEEFVAAGEGTLAISDGRRGTDWGTVALRARGG